MKGYVRIGGSVLVGVIVILGAFYLRDHNLEQNASGTIVTVAPEREYITTQDSDGDGVKDWEESLTAHIFEAIPTPTSTLGIAPDAEYHAPTTFTGKFSEAFFQDYLNNKMVNGGTVDTAALIGGAVEAIDKNTESKRHSRLELTTTASSPETLRTYGNRIGEIVKTYSIESENEAAILQRALGANDPAVLEKLVPLHDAYAHILQDSLTVAVPDTLVTAHLDLVNAYEAILTDIEAMQVAFTDPLYTLARVRGYENDALALYNALQSIAVVMKQNNVTYSMDEAGAILYLFESV